MAMEKRKENRGGGDFGRPSRGEGRTGEGRSSTRQGGDRQGRSSTRRSTPGDSEDGIPSGRPQKRERGERGERTGRGARGRRREERQEKRLEEVQIEVFRCSATVKGGRRQSFGTLMAVGDQNGQVGIGYGKAKEVPGATKKALKAASRSLIKFPIMENGSIPHQIIGRFGGSSVVLIPAGPGTGIIAGSTVKAILEMGGVRNILTKSHGSTNSRNLSKATMNALANLRSREDVYRLRKLPLPEKVKAEASKAEGTEA